MEYKNKKFYENSQEVFLISGEFPYFRVPRNDWERRLKIFKEHGGNNIATYVPWIIYEPEEGHIDFSYCDQINLSDFLTLAQSMNISVTLRPGPYQYSELRNGGLPDWLLKNYPEIMATDINGKNIALRAVSYLHPVFLEKTRKYYKAFADEIKPFLNRPVRMIQVDNECMGVHLWKGSPDCNRQTMGFGEDNGRYTNFLKKKFADIRELNKTYGTNVKDFKDFTPVTFPRKTDKFQCRQAEDYAEFYHETVGEFLLTLKQWLNEYGINLPICHNSANPNMTSRFSKIVDKMGDDFLFGVDHYYNLDRTWPQNSPSPQTAIRDFVSLERLRLMGMQPAVLEMQAGSPSDIPPMLYEDLLAWYRMNIAFGMRGVNFYIFTGGPNFNNTGITTDIYDYNSFIHADGTLNSTFNAFSETCDFLNKNTALLNSNRAYSVKVAINDNETYIGKYDYNGVCVPQNKIQKFLEGGILPALFASKYSPKLCKLDSVPDTDVPLIVPSSSVMPKTEQENLLQFVSNGGKLILAGAVPEYDENYDECTVLKDKLFNGIDFKKAYTKPTQPVTPDKTRLYNTDVVQKAENLTADCKVILSDSDEIYGFKKGNVVFLGILGILKTFAQAQLFEKLLTSLDTKPTVYCSNRSLITSLLENKNTGKKSLFVMNLYSGKQTTDITVYGNKINKFTEIELKPMEVKNIDLTSQLSMF